MAKAGPLEEVSPSLCVEFSAIAYHLDVLIVDVSPNCLLFRLIHLKFHGDCLSIQPYHCASPAEAPPRRMMRDEAIVVLDKHFVSDFRFCFHDIPPQIRLGWKMGLPAFLCSSAISTDGRSMVPQQPGEIQSYQVPQYCCSGVCRVSGRSSIRSPQAGHWGISMRAVYFIAILPFHIHFIFSSYRARSKSARSWL